MMVTGTGDPFGSPLYWWMLKNIDGDHAGDFELTLYTNSLLWTPKRWDKVKNIHRVTKNAIISLDAGTKETYKLNRGGDWDLLMDNLEFITTLGLRHVTLMCAVQANNYHEMTKVIDLARKFKANRVEFCQLVNWGAMTPRDFKK